MITHRLFLTTGFACRLVVALTTHRLSAMTEQNIHISITYETVLITFVVVVLEVFFQRAFLFRSVLTQYALVPFDTNIVPIGLVPFEMAGLYKGFMAKLTLVLPLTRVVCMFRMETQIALAFTCVWT